MYVLARTINNEYNNLVFKIPSSDDYDYIYDNTKCWVLGDSFYPNSIYVSGGKVYVSGTESGGGRAVLWIDGVVHLLSEKSSSASCVFVR